MATCTAGPPKAMVPSLSISPITSRRWRRGWSSGCIISLPSSDRRAGGPHSAGTRPFAELGPEIGLEGEDFWRHRLGPQLAEAFIAAVALGVPLIGAPTRGDVVDQLPHRRRHIEVVVPVRSRHLSVLAG